MSREQAELFEPEQAGPPPHLLRARTDHSDGPPPSTKVVVRNYASPACLETARRADRLIELLIRNQRTTQVERLLVAYTVAARQCRQDASPTP
jgi:hypothetical protein